MNVKYDRVVCINLDRRPDNWKEFLNGIPADFPFGDVERFSAIDGKKCPHPEWWRGGGGAWGCYCSHKRIIEDCLIDGVNSVLIFEDDALFCDDFAKKIEQYHDALPDDSQWIYYGGQHLKRATRVPKRVNDYVYKPYNVNRTHAYGIIGQEAMRALYVHLNARNWYSPHHVDHHYGELCQTGKLRVYCPANWLVDQRGGRSDVAGRVKEHNHWKDASDIDARPQNPYYVIMGCHSSGSSALAGALYHLGVYLGDKLVGMYGEPPIKGGEAIFLFKLYERAFKIPRVESSISKDVLKNRLKNYIDQRRRHANEIGAVAAGKYPQMALTYDILKDILENNLRVIWIDRNINESIVSLQKRFPETIPEKVAEHQRAIYENSKRAYKELGERAIRVSYDDLLTDPKKEIIRCADFMGLTPSEYQLKQAAKYILPDKKHVRLQAK